MLHLLAKSIFPGPPVVSQSLSSCYTICLLIFVYVLSHFIQERILIMRRFSTEMSFKHLFSTEYGLSFRVEAQHVLMNERMGMAYHS